MASWDIPWTDIAQLTLFFKYPNLYRSVSALAPIVNPATVPWDEKVFSHYLGNNREEWKKHDASELVKQASAEVHARPILIDQGTGDKFLGENLQPELFEAACKASG